MYTRPATIDINNSTRAVKWDIDSVTFSFTYDTEQILSDLSSFAFSGGGISSYNIYRENNVNYLTLYFPKNLTDNEKTISGQLYVTESYDGTNVTVSDTLTITQGAHPHIVVNPSSLSVPGIEQTSQWLITAVGFDNPVFQNPSNTGDFSLSGETITYPTVDTMSYSAVIPA